MIPLRRRYPRRGSSCPITPHTPELRSSERGSACGEPRALTLPSCHASPLAKRRDREVGRLDSQERSWPTPYLRTWSKHPGLRTTSPFAGRRTGGDLGRPVAAKALQAFVVVGLDDRGCSRSHEEGSCDTSRAATGRKVDGQAIVVGPFARNPRPMSLVLVRARNGRAPGRAPHSERLLLFEGSLRQTAGGHDLARGRRRDAPDGMAPMLGRSRKRPLSGTRLEMGAGSDALPHEASSLTRGSPKGVRAPPLSNVRVLGILQHFARWGSRRLLWITPSASWRARPGESR